MKGSASISLMLIVCLCIATVTGYGQDPTHISAGLTYKNLTIYLIHGPDAGSTRDIITLESAMDTNVFKVYETEDVNELAVENLSPTHDVFIQSGDIVKGGKQDRILAVSVIISRLSGRIPIEAFCVESDRWDSRDDESETEFSSSKERIVSKELRVAAGGRSSGDGAGSGRGRTIGSGSTNANGTGSGQGVGSGSGDVSGLGAANSGVNSSATAVRVNGGSQSQVWNEVATVQSNITSNMLVDVTANSSASSLQLSLENKKLKKTTEDFEKRFADLISGKNDIIGYAFAINGKINSADIYMSNDLFVKVWPKMLRAAVVEAISLANRSRSGAQPTAADVRKFLNSAESGQPSQRQSVAGAIIITRESASAIVYEARNKSSIIIHRSYVRLD